MFVDRAKIYVQAGSGGDGCASFRREKYVPKGGPDGGDGGDGGSVIIQAFNGVNSLANVVHRTHWRAEAGERGRGSNQTGAAASDLIIQVPPGTLVYDMTTDLLLKDLAEEGASVIAAQGGKGGKGNTRFKSATNRAPREFTRGEAGEARHLMLELKVIADVGLVGRPNAGKSTLLSRVSRARPEIADYPFTTKFPNLGLVHVDVNHSFVMADIPGLIEGAHAGVGLGFEFLRHIERAGILVHLVEPSPVDGTDPIANYHSIRQELRLYKAPLLERPEIVAVTKCELPGAEEVRAKLQADLGRDVLAISAVTGEGLNALTRRVAQTLEQSNESRESAATESN